MVRFIIFFLLRSIAEITSQPEMSKNLQFPFCTLSLLCFGTQVTTEVTLPDTFFFFCYLTKLIFFVGYGVCKQMPCTKANKLVPVVGNVSLVLHCLTGLKHYISTAPKLSSRKIIIDPKLATRHLVWPIRVFQTPNMREGKKNIKSMQKIDTCFKPLQKLDPIICIQNHLLSHVGISHSYLQCFLCSNYMFMCLCHCRIPCRAWKMETL